MKKVEIIANQSIQPDVVDALNALQIGDRYTVIPNILGSGSTGGRFGTTVWPEYNFMMVLYVDDDKVEPLARCCRKIKELFPDEGIKMVAWEAELFV